MKKQLIYIIITLFIPVINSCISEYIPDYDYAENILVVNGFITNDSTKIQLTQSVGLDKKTSSAKFIYGAQLYIECSDGHQFGPGKYTDNGNYTIYNGTLAKELSYRLKIVSQGEEYVSEFLQPLMTAPIDSVTWKKEAKGQPVEIFVSTHDDQDQSKYYSWSYQEIWEFHSSLYANAGIRDNKLVIFSNSPSGNYNDRYYCWSSTYSSKIIIESTYLLSKNIIRNKKIQEISASDRRLSVLYYIQVSQTQIRKAAFDYFNNLKKNVEESGSIFSPIPTELKGNIRCTTNKAINAIGYIDVSVMQKKNLYIPNSNGLYEPSNNPYCIEIEDNPAGYIIATYDPFIGITYAPQICVDCIAAGGTKKKPAFWPNDHK